MLFSFQNITHYFGDGFAGIPLFEDVGYTMLPGGLLIVKGANGSGKTTLLKILSGLITPKNGFVFYDFNSGKSFDPKVTEISEDYKAYFKHIHYLSHNDAVDPILTVKENLEFWAGLNDLKEGIAPAIKFFKLENVLDKECRKLSAGWNRRIALARLILRKSSLWILDEPFTNLDEEVIDLTLRMIASFCDQGGMVILSCHQEVNLPFGVELKL